MSGVLLVDGAAWAASTTFSFTGLYEKREVDAFRSAVRDTFLGVSESPVRSDDLRGKQFSTHRLGYVKTQVEAFVEAAGLRLAAMESTDRPEEPLVSGAILAGWAEWVDSTRFETTRRLWEGYATVEVDAFRKELRDTFLGVRPPPLTWDEAHHKQFTPTRLRPGYKVEQVDAFLDKAEQRLAAKWSDVVRRALKSPSLLGYARRGLSSGCTYWISSADLDVVGVYLLD